MDAQDESHYGLADPNRLAKIDKLFACGVGDLVSLPQIIVVGDQSSGKSSVLEGLIGKPLPRDSGLCTRFATQIIFKRSATESITVSIIPSTDATKEHQKSLNEWSKPELQSLDSSAFASIVAEVHEVMGLFPLQQGKPSKGSVFSRDVLRLEICGPSQEHLSVIDVPGIFKNVTPGLTTKDDISLVRNLVLGYMENPRSVMLTVIPANVDVATQEILQFAADVDPDGKRTLGVLTKPDLVDRGAEPRVVDLLEGQAHPLRLGWHVVRNLGQMEMSDPFFNRLQVELSFFNSHAPWNKLTKEKVGIESLRIRLQDILSELVQQEFPKVKQEINKKMSSARSQLQNLGMERETSDKQLIYLTELSTQFQRMVILSVDAKYGSSEIFDNLELRLATLVTARNAMFSDDMRRCGQEFRFSALETQEQATEDLPPVLTRNQNDNVDANDETVFDVRKYVDCTDIEDLLHAQESLCAANKRSIASWLRKMYESSRGFELGTFDSSMLATTMRIQTTKWPAIALGYISDIATIVHRFIDQVLQSICSDIRVKSELLSVIMDGLIERYNKAMDQVRFLLDVERTGTPMTLNYYFNDTLNKCREMRMQTRMSQMSFSDCTHGTVIKLEDMTQNHPMSNVEYVVQDLHDLLFSYYEIVRQRFVDGICMQAADHYLITGMETPLTLFSPKFVSSLNTEQLELIAGEEQGTRRKRAQLNRNIASLEEAKKILR